MKSDFFGSDVETKLQSSQSVRKWSPRPNFKKKHKKHGWVSQRWRCCWLYLFFNCKGTAHYEICSTWSDGKLTVVPGSFNLFQGRCAQEDAWIMGKLELDAAPQQCSNLSITPHRQLSGTTSDILCSPSALLSGLSPGRLFPVYKTWNHFEKDLVSKQKRAFKITR